MAAGKVELGVGGARCSSGGVRVRGDLATHVNSTRRVVGILVMLLGGFGGVEGAVAVGGSGVGPIGGGLFGGLQLGEEVGGGGGGLVHGHVELLLGEETLERVGGGLELGVHGAGLGFAEGGADGHVVAAGRSGRIVVVSLKELALALVVLGLVVGVAKLVACPARLARGLGAARALRVADAELVGM